MVWLAGPVAVGAKEAVKVHEPPLFTGVPGTHVVSQVKGAAHADTAALKPATTPQVESVWKLVNVHGCPPTEVRVTVRVVVPNIGTWPKSTGLGEIVTAGAATAA